ncbi:MAG: hypothetical protein ABW071_03625 [Casimicrobiaceae bacterium]
MALNAVVVIALPPLASQSNRRESAWARLLLSQFHATLALAEQTADSASYLLSRPIRSSSDAVLRRTIDGRQTGDAHQSQARSIALRA